MIDEFDLEDIPVEDWDEDATENQEAISWLLAQQGYKTGDLSE